MAATEIEMRRQRMADDLDKAIARLTRAARRAYYATFTLAIVGIGASILAGILSFVKADAVVVGILALIPAMTAILLGRLKLQERASWFYGKREALYTLYNNLHFELPDPVTAESLAEISRTWSEINLEREKEWLARLTFSADDLSKPVKQS